MNRNIVVGVTVVVVVVVAAVWYWMGQSSSSYPAYTGPVDKVTLGVETSLLTAAVWVAESKGYFQNQGLDVTIEEFDSGRLSFLDMLEGGVDISTVAPTPIMFNSFERDDFSIFGTFVYSDDDVKVIARKDVGITEAADLNGKKVGTPAGTTGQFFLAAFLAHRDMTGSDVEAIDIKPSDLPAALQSGQVDAIVIWEPHAYNAQQLLGDNVVRLPSSDVYRETFNFMVMNDFASANSAALSRFLIAIDQATTYIEKNKNESQMIVADRLGLKSGVMTVLWNDFVFDLALEQSLILTLEDEANWAIDSALTDKEKVPNYLDYLYLDALQTMKPQAVRIVK